MKKYILSFISVITLFLVGCGGGGGSSVTYDDPTIIENKLFYTVKAEEPTMYLKERFSSNSEGILEVAKYEIDNDEFPVEDNTTIPYYIQSPLVYILYDGNYKDYPNIRCSVIDSDVSVEFYCLEEGQSGTLSLYTTRWKTLEDAILNPE